MIKFQCNHCQKKIAMPDEHAGKQAKCPACKQIVRIPSLAGAAASPSQGAWDGGQGAPGSLPGGLQIGAPRRRSLGQRMSNFWSAYWPILRFIVPPLIVLCIVAAIGGGVYWKFFRDSWETDNLPRFQADYAQAADLRSQGDLPKSLEAYEKLVSSIKSHAVLHPLQDSHLIELEQNAKKELEDVRNQIETESTQKTARMVPELRKMEATADAIPYEKGIKAAEAYSAILSKSRDLDGTNAELMIVQKRVEEKLAKVNKRNEDIRAYLTSIDPFVQTTIPFLRRLRWGMPDWTFINRAPDLITAWRGIQDPPDRSSIGVLLSKTNNLAGSLALVARKVQDRQGLLTAGFYADNLVKLRPAEVPITEWGPRAQAYASSLAGIKYLGQTVRFDDEDYQQFVDRFKDLEDAYRKEYQLRLDIPYAGQLSMLTKGADKEVQKRFVESSAEFRELALKTFRHLERGMERNAFIVRLHELDLLFGKIQDPPDDTTVGHFLDLPNTFAEQVYVYSFSRPGKSYLDIVNQSPEDAKIVNDKADTFDADYSNLTGIPLPKSGATTVPEGQ
jgi:hypothetical protein